MSLSRLCAILAKYKRAFEASMTTAAPGEGYPRDYVNHFNGFLMDICNCLWRNRAFNKEDTNALGCLLPDSVLPALREAATARGYSLPTLFSLSHSEALCALSIACFREFEDRAAEANTAIRVRHAGPVTQRSLTILGNDGGLKVSWGDYRLEVLKWLEEKGLTGIGELMYNTLKQLMLAKGSGASTAVVTA
jgi:centromere protein I